MRSRPKILVIESDRNILAALRISLAGGGLRPIVCGNPEDALKKLNLIPVDLVVTELRFNGYCDSGLLFLRNLRDTLPHLPIIILSDGLDEELEKRLDSLRVNAFLSKPIELPSLKRKIRSLLDRQEREAAKYLKERDARRRGPAPS